LRKMPTIDPSRLETPARFSNSNCFSAGFSLICPG
jgi:hypothetical protein